MGKASIDHAATARFEADRARLASLAYRLLGSASDAEDAVQDAFVRWQAADRALIEVPEAWLTRVVANLCVDRLRSARARRERAAGDWLPEPVLDGDPMLGPAETAEQRESVSIAVLRLMERLGPVERAVYVLREAFGHTHREIAEILDISEAASQQYTHRARRRLAGAPRGGRADRASARRIVEAFIEAASSGRTERLVSLLTEDATGMGDGAGLAARPLRFATPERIAAAFRAGYRPTEAKRRLAGGTPAIHADLVNGAPALVAVLDGRVLGVVVLDLGDGGIAAVHGIASRERLGRLDAAWSRREPDTPVVAKW